MTEEEARQWCSERFGLAMPLLTALIERVTAENERQNLIAPSTVAEIWNRHLVDSAQLVALAPPEGTWLDVGTGGGFPGLVIAILRVGPIILVEPRRLRAEFLRQCVADLRLDHVTVAASRIEAVRETAAVISARAVSSVENLLRAALPCATQATRWLLPQGQSGSNIAALRQRWTGVFHVEQSLTSRDSSILIIDGPARR